MYICGKAYTFLYYLEVLCPLNHEDWMWKNNCDFTVPIKQALPCCPVINALSRTPPWSRTPAWSRTPPWSRAGGIMVALPYSDWDMENTPTFCHLSSWLSLAKAFSKSCWSAKRTKTIPSSAPLRTSTTVQSLRKCLTSSSVVSRDTPVIFNRYSLTDSLTALCVVTLLYKEGRNDILSWKLPYLVSHFKKL